MRIFSIAVVVLIRLRSVVVQFGLQCFYPDLVMSQFGWTGVISGVLWILWV
eukprot:gene2979-1961_t